MAIPALKDSFLGNLILKRTTLNDFSIDMNYRYQIDDY